MASLSDALIAAGHARLAAFQEATAEFGAAPSFRELKVLCDCHRA